MDSITYPAFYMGSTVTIWGAFLGYIIKHWRKHDDEKKDIYEQVNQSTPEWMKRDITHLKTDVAEIKTDIQWIKKEINRNGRRKL